MKLKAYGICIYKKENSSIKILLCKSTVSKEKWGFLKGVQELFESKEDTAIREFKEESSIIVDKNKLEKYFEQQNKKKDIGIFLVNFDNIQNISNYFDNDRLQSKYLSWENSQVKFFPLQNLPKIKKKQTEIVVKISEYLQRNSNVSRQFT